MSRDINNSNIDQAIHPREYQDAINEYTDYFFKTRYSMTYGGDTLPSWDDADRAIKNVINKSPDAFYERLVNDETIDENVRLSLFEKLINDYAPSSYPPNKVLTDDNYVTATLKFVGHEESLLPKKHNKPGFFSSLFSAQYPKQPKINDLLRLLENISPDAIKSEGMQNQALKLEARLRERLDPGEGIELKKRSSGSILKKW